MIRDNIFLTVDYPPSFTNGRKMGKEGDKRYSSSLIIQPRITIKYISTAFERDLRYTKWDSSHLSVMIIQMNDI